MTEAGTDAIDLRRLPTEGRNPHTMDLDVMTPLEIARAMNDEDAHAVAAVRAVLPQVAEAIDYARTTLEHGGRIVYVGAGTSGRLGVLDAAECPPTFGATDDQVIGILAGGRQAMFSAVEGAEDSLTLCEEDLRSIGLTSRDLVVGLAASGRTPYVVGGLRYASSIGCTTVAIACVADSVIGREATLAIEPMTGPEVLSGSTRLKAGTAEKMILNMISTGAMVGIGKAYQNLMVDVRPSNEKLRARAVAIVRDACGCTNAQASQALAEASGEAKVAIVMLALDVSADEAARTLKAASGRVRDALGTLREV